MRAQLWLVGTARTLTATAVSLTDLTGDQNRCDAAISNLLTATSAYLALRADFGGGRFCAAARDANYLNLVDDLSEKLRSNSRTNLASAMPIAVGAFEGRGANHFAIQVDDRSAKPKWTATALVDPATLEETLRSDPNTGDIVALMAHGQKVIAAVGANSSDRGWLPSTEANGETYRTARARSRTGATFSYGTQSVLGPDLYILTRFDDTPRQMAWLRFLVLAAAPLFMLAALYFAYSRAIQSEILQWIDGMRAAILARRSGVVGALAPVKQGMPSELRDFAVLFNEMSQESAIRERSLKLSIAENQFLLRELNHRVKSSLQIIQSYLSLTRRLDRTTANRSGVAAMEARVQVLSIAYREALSEGRMQDVRIRQFAEEIVDSLSQSFKRPGVLLELKADVQAALMVDRAIPFGLALVESVMADWTPKPLMP